MEDNTVCRLCRVSCRKRHAIPYIIFHLVERSILNVLLIIIHDAAAVCNNKEYLILPYCMCVMCTALIREIWFQRCYILINLISSAFAQGYS